jgi:L-asparaginase
MRKVLFQFTGGTISMKIDPVKQGAVPVMSGREILNHVPGLDSLCEAEVADFSMVPGPHMTPERMWELGASLDRRLAAPEVAGAVVTHGTDTIEETAFFLDLVLKTTKPVVLTGSMRNSSELSWDGPANLMAAARVALDGRSEGQGVFVVAAQEAHRAREVRKSDTQAMDTFASPRSGAAALIDGDEVLWLSEHPAGPRYAVEGLDSRVWVIPAVTGDYSLFVDHAVSEGARGLVLEGTGRGNVPPAMVGAVERARGAGVAVVIATRCWEGQVLPVYAYPGSGGDLRRLGVVFSQRLPAHKARLLLMVLLGAGVGEAGVREAFEG